MLLIAAEMFMLLPGTQETELHTITFSFTRDTG